MMDPKPQKRKKGRVKTAKASTHVGNVKGLPCVVCGASGPSDAHHVFHDRYSGKKASDWATIPLCKRHHQNSTEAIHSGKTDWRDKHGPDWSYILETLQAIYGDEYSIDH